MLGESVEVGVVSLVDGRNEFAVEDGRIRLGGRLCWLNQFPSTYVSGDVTVLEPQRSARRGERLRQGSFEIEEARQVGECLGGVLQ